MPNGSENREIHFATISKKPRTGYLRTSKVRASSPATRSLDHETAKLNEISTQLTIVQMETADAQNKQKSGNASNTLPEVAQNPLIVSLKSEIARQEAKLQDGSREPRQEHPQLQNHESEIASLKNTLETETQKITRGFSTSRDIGKDKEVELGTAIKEQRKKLLQIKRYRDRAAVLTRDVEAAHNAFEAVSQRFNQTSLESQSTHANVSVLTPATEPIEPSFPEDSAQHLGVDFSRHPTWDRRGPCARNTRSVGG